jgi:hypothetical protein
MRYVCFILVGLCCTVATRADELKSVLVPTESAPKVESMTVPVEISDVPRHCPDGNCQRYTLETHETVRERKLLRGGYVLRQSARTIVRPIKRR